MAASEGKNLTHNKREERRGILPIEKGIKINRPGIVTQADCIFFPN